MPPNAILPTRFVAPQIIQEAFNSGQFWERAQRGELSTVLKRNSHPEPSPKGEPSCTHSQFIVYYTPAGEAIAGVHQYVRPDGTLGGSGRPDPKRLVVGSEILCTRATPH